MKMKEILRRIRNLFQKEVAPAAVAKKWADEDYYYELEDGYRKAVNPEWTEEEKRRRVIEMRNRDVKNDRWGICAELREAFDVVLERKSIQEGAVRAEAERQKAKNADCDDHAIYHKAKARCIELESKYHLNKEECGELWNCQYLMTEFEYPGCDD